jgi:hypothetical protein
LQLDLVLEIVVGTRTRRLELSQLGEKCEAGSVELESVARGYGCPFQRRSLPGRGLAKAGPKTRDLQLVLPDGRFELHPPLATPPVRARRSAGLPAEQRGLRTRGVERAAEETHSGLLVGAGEDAGAIDGSHDDPGLAIPGHCPIQRRHHLLWGTRGATTRRRPRVRRRLGLLLVGARS